MEKVEIGDDTTKTMTIFTTSPRSKYGKSKNGEGNVGLQYIMQSVLLMCRENNNIMEEKNIGPKPYDILIENQLIPALDEIINQHKTHLKFL